MTEEPKNIGKKVVKFILALFLLALAFLACFIFFGFLSMTKSFQSFSVIPLIFSLLVLVCIVFLFKALFGGMKANNNSERRVNRILLAVLIVTLIATAAFSIPLIGVFFFRP